MRRRKNGNRFHGARGPVRRRGVSQHSLVELQRDSVTIESAVETRAIDQANMKQPERAALLVLPDGLQKPVAGSHIALLVGDQSADEVRTSSNGAGSHVGATDGVAGFVHHGASRA